MSGTKNMYIHVFMVVKKITFSNGIGEKGFPFYATYLPLQPASWKAKENPCELTLDIRYIVGSLKRTQPPLP